MDGSQACIHLHNMYIHMEATKKVDEILKRSKLEEFMDALPVLVKHSLAK
jgi:hypothetical protein